MVVVTRPPDDPPPPLWSPQVHANSNLQPTHNFECGAAVSLDQESSPPLERSPEQKYQDFLQALNSYVLSTCEILELQGSMPMVGQQQLGPQTQTPGPFFAPNHRVAPHMASPPPNHRVVAHMASPEPTNHDQRRHSEPLHNCDSVAAFQMPAERLHHPQHSRHRSTEERLAETRRVDTRRVEPTAPGTLHTEKRQTKPLNPKGKPLNPKEKPLSPKGKPLSPKNQVSNASSAPHTQSSTTKLTRSPSELGIALWAGMQKGISGPVSRRSLEFTKQQLEEQAAENMKKRHEAKVHIAAAQHRASNVPAPVARTLQHQDSLATLESLDSGRDRFASTFAFGKASNKVMKQDLRHERKYQSFVRRSHDVAS